MFENPRRGRQARNFYNKCSENDRSQIVFRTDIFRKLTLGAPDMWPAWFAVPLKSLSNSGRIKETTFGFFYRIEELVSKKISDYF